jgi:cytidyltransferase-like protein
MTQIVIMPGGFHPFHAGHATLYNSAREAFPNAEVYVAATNDTSSRPFPFAVKEKLAKLAGVEPGHFVQVKSPFQAQEITSKFDPAQDQLIFVRSEKDATKPPQAGGVKKDGSPSYLQPLKGQKQLQPFSKHAYMTYLPTVEFGPGMTSATEIRTAWPQLNDKRKTALVMSLYPKTQNNVKLAQNVVQLLDTAIGSEQDVAEGSVTKKPQPYNDPDWIKKLSPEQLRKLTGPNYKKKNQEKRAVDKSVDENQGWAATYNESDDYIEEKWSQKYKSSINCSNPKGFSQKAHCAGRKK